MIERRKGTMILDKEQVAQALGVYVARQFGIYGVVKVSATIPADIEEYRVTVEETDDEPRN